MMDTPPAPLSAIKMSRCCSSGSYSANRCREDKKSRDDSPLPAILDFAYSCNDDGDENGGSNSSTSGCASTSDGSTSYRFPDSSAKNSKSHCLSLAQSQCCTVQAYDYNTGSSAKKNRSTCSPYFHPRDSSASVQTVQVNAFPTSNSTGVELCCHDPENGKSSFFQIDLNHEISKIVLVPLLARQKAIVSPSPISSASPSSPSNPPASLNKSSSTKASPNYNSPNNSICVERNQAAAVMLIVAHTSGLSIYSLVFTRLGDSDLFSVSESRELSESTGTCTLSGRRVTDLQVKLVSATPSDNDTNAAGVTTPTQQQQSSPRMQPHLLVATSSTTSPLIRGSENQGSETRQHDVLHKVDVFAYPLVDHICPVFRFPRGLVAPIPAGYRYHSELLTDVDQFKSLSFGHTRPSGACSLAVLSASKLRILPLPSLQETDDGQDEDLADSEASILLPCGAKSHGNSTTENNHIGEPVLVIPYMDTGCDNSFVILCKPKIDEVQCSLTTQQQCKKSVSFISEELPTVYETSAPSTIHIEAQDGGEAKKSGTPRLKSNTRTKPRTFFQSPEVSSPRDRPFDETPGGADLTESMVVSPDDQDGQSQSQIDSNSFADKLGCNAESLIVSPDSDRDFQIQQTPNIMSPLAGLNLLHRSTLETPIFSDSRITPNSRKNAVYTPEKKENAAEQLAHILVVHFPIRGHFKHIHGTKSQFGNGCSHKICASALPSKLASFNYASMTWMYVDGDASSGCNDHSLLFTPSPVAKQLSHENDKLTRNSLPLLCVAANTTGSSQLHVTVMSPCEKGDLQVEFDRAYETKNALVKLLNNTTRKYEIRSIALEQYKLLTNIKQEGNGYSQKHSLPGVRILLYAKSAEENTETGEAPGGTSSVLTEDGRVIVGFVSLPLFDADGTEATSSTRAMSSSLSSFDPAMAKLEEIANSFRRFEAKMTRRMESIEKTLYDNTSRIKVLENSMESLTALEI